MRGWWLLGALALVPACSDDNTGPGDGPPDVPATLASTSLDGAIALFWSDNSFVSDPDIFAAYHVYSTPYDLDTQECDDSWRLEGTTVAPEFIVGALTNGVPRCYEVTAVAVDGAESDPSPFVFDTPRPDARNVVLFARQASDAESGFRFWQDLNGDGLADDNELGLVRSGSASDIDFAVDRELDGSFTLTLVRQGTGAEFYADIPVEDLTSIDFAEDRSYASTPIEAAVGFGYVFEMVAEADDFARYGAIRVTHVGQEFLILDWAFQTDPGNPELIVAGR